MNISKDLHSGDNTIRIGIYGYGNLGKGIESSILQSPDTVLAAVFTRREPSSLQLLTPDAPVIRADQLQKYVDDIDVLILCGGSATDLPVQTPEAAKFFNTVDSFDTHANIPQHFERVDKSAREHGHLSLISAGWDPGLFSINRLYGQAILPSSNTYTFWGKGISQGHSDAIRRINGVLDARQYTIPVPETVQSVLNGNNPTLCAKQKHTRECFVVVKDDADKDAIREEICSMPNYFADYNTTVNFVSKEVLLAEHSSMAHGGSVLVSGITGNNTKQLIEYNLTLDSNPEFTSNVLLAAARAVYRMSKQGRKGAITLFDVPPALLSPLSQQDLLASLL